MQPLVSALKVRPGEGRLVALQIGVMFCAAMGGAVGVNSVDALFFARFGAQFLPYMYMGLGVVTCLTLLGTATLLGRIPRERLYVALPAALATILLIERGILSLGFSWFYPILWLVASMTITRQVLFTWGLAGLITDTRQANR